MHRREVRLLSSAWYVSQIVGYQDAVNMASCLGRLFNLNEECRGTFVQCCCGAIPGERPTPVHTDFVVDIDDVSGAKFMPEDFALILNDAEREVLALTGPVRVAHPNLVIAGARYLNILVNGGAR